ncbi:unnamed protein product [Effrenium voratum]|uniref:Uncharacterized protein n=1 Tax=Effrenium voratum TaxID=2562239 RepID=A0AA36HK31_9DINO|nr:unnamed protein product [Effrenium voratum]CAJ1412984.1 unnamed protein product [Effrenium voratum]
MAEEEKQETLQVSKKQAAQLGGAGPARTVEQRTSTQILLAPNAGGAEVTIRGAPAGVAKALTMLKVLVAFKEAASPEERGLCHWFACGFCRDGEDEDGCEAGLHSATLSAETQAAWLGKAPKDAKVKARPLLLAISCGGVGPPLPAPGQLSAPRTGGGIGCPEEDLIELCLVAMDWEDAAEVSRFHRFVRPNAWDQQDAEMRKAHQAECFAEKPPALHFTDVLADLLDWLPRLVGVSLDEMRPEDLLFISPRDWEVQCLLPRRCAASGSVDYELQDFFFNRWCCLKDVFREHFALPNEAAPTGLGAMARYLGLPPGDKIRRTKCLDENALVVRVVMELLKKGWKPKATAWRGNVQGHTTFLLPRRGDLPAAGYDENSRKRGFWEMQGSPPPPPAPEAAPPPILGPIVGATAKVAPKPPWQRPEQPMPPWVLAPTPAPPSAPPPAPAAAAAAAPASTPTARKAAPPKPAPPPEPPETEQPEQPEQPEPAPEVETDD